LGRSGLGFIGALGFGSGRGVGLGLAARAVTPDCRGAGRSAGLADDARERGHGGGEKGEKERGEGESRGAAVGLLITERASGDAVGAGPGCCGAERSVRSGAERIKALRGGAELRVATGEGGRGRGKLTAGPARQPSRGKVKG
jgi:hypothetical protein